MVRIIKVLVVLAVIGFVALAGYAYFGDLTPETTRENQPVTLEPE